MLLISSQSLNGHNSASRRDREGLKKGKSSEFNPQDYEQVKSSPALMVWPLTHMEKFGDPRINFGAMATI